MASWRPQTEFEHEIVSLQPEYNFIFGDLTDAQRKLENQSQLQHLGYKDMETKINEDSSALHAIRMVQALPGAKRFSIQPDDLDNENSVGLETIAMIRYCGMGPSSDGPLDIKKTIPTLPIPKTIHNNKKRYGQINIPVLLDDEFFRIETTRSRNRKLIENSSIGKLSKDLNNIKLFQEEPPITVLNEIDVEKEIKANEYQNYINDFPKLGESNISSMGNAFNNDILPPSTNHTSRATKQMQRNSVAPLRENRENVKLSEKLDCNSNLSQSMNDSASGHSSYESFDKNDSCNSSVYFSANESLNISRKKKTVKNDRTAVKILQGNENVVKNKDKKYYTPKEVYDFKKYM